MARNVSRALVTGGAGFIGSHIVDRLIKDGTEVTVLDDLSSGSRKNLSAHVGKKGFRFVLGDIRDRRLVRRLVKVVDVVFHDAAITSVPHSVKDPMLTNDVNLNGTLNLLEACAGSRSRRFVFASSCAVYGNSQTSPQHEGLQPSPLSPYAVTKASAEDYCRVFNEIYGLETVSLRLFNVYGSRQSSGEYSGVITKFIERLGRGDPPIIYGDGEQTRDFVYVEDVVQAHILASRSPDAVGETINIGTGQATSVNRLANLLMEIMRARSLKAEYRDGRSGDVRHSCGDITKAQRLLGYDPEYTLKDGLGRLVQARVESGINRSL